MSISRISGQMLQANLYRDGNNLSFSNTSSSGSILYIDVGNNRIGVNTSGPSTALQVAGTITVGNITIPNVGNVSVGNVYINNLTDPVQNQDAATKYYVDHVVSSTTGNVLGNTL